MTSIWALAIMLSCSGTVRAEGFRDRLVTPGRLVVATTANAPPMTTVAADGTPTGFDVDLCRTIAARLDLSVDVVRVDFAAAVPGLIAGRFDMVCSSTSRTQARLASPDLFVSEPTAGSETTLMTGSASPGIVGTADGHGKRLGAVRGGQEAALARDTYGADSTLALYPGFAELVLDLRNGRIDAAVGSSIVFADFARRDPSLRVVAPGLRAEGISPYSFGLLVRRAEPGLLEQVNAQLAALEADGGLARLRQQWLGSAGAAPAR